MICIDVVGFSFDFLQCLVIIFLFWHDKESKLFTNLDFVLSKFDSKSKGFFLL